MRNPFAALIDATGPSTALQELLYGFIMELIFVNAALFEIMRFDDALDFIIVITGMNATWGAIDGIIFYYLGVGDQLRYNRIIRNDDNYSREYRKNVLISGFSSSPLNVLTDEEQERICDEILDKELQSAEQERNDRIDMAKSSIGCWILTMLTLIPMIVPLLLISDFYTALSVGTVLCSIILFGIGYLIAPYLGQNRWITGLILAGFSLLISLISTFTGG